MARLMEELNFQCYLNFNAFKLKWTHVIGSYHNEQCGPKTKPVPQEV